jgi:hypothetical protein
MPEPLMSKSPRHPLALADLMILVGATALGLVGTRSFRSGFPVATVLKYERFQIQTLMLVLLPALGWHWCRDSLALRILRRSPPVRG